MRAKTVNVIMTDTFEGKGTPEDPMGTIRRYWTLEGELIAENLYLGECVKPKIKQRKIHKNIEGLRQEEQGPEQLVNQIDKLIMDEYEKIRETSENYSDLKESCKKRSREIGYRHSELGGYIDRKFAEFVKEDLKNKKVEDRA